MTTTALTPFQITAGVAKLSTADMFESLEDLEDRAGEWHENLSPAEVTTRDALEAAIENRHRLRTAALEAQAELETAHPFERITYPQVLRKAMERTGQTIN